MKTLDLSDAKALKKLYATLGYQFTDGELAQAALTHRSAGNRNNERLEFLGDAILGMVVAEILYRQDDNWPEGDLSRLRASLVNRDTLAEIASDLKLGDWLALGPGELKSGGFRRKSILADAIEALIGAVYLDAAPGNGFSVARDFIVGLYGKRLVEFPSPDILKDPKTRLQEWLQARNYALPCYELTGVSGKAHEQQFSVDCLLDKFSLQTTGKARSRRAAEQLAADSMLAKLL